MKTLLISAICVLASMTAATASAEPSQLGQTGLIHMPDGRLEQDGTLRAGIGYMAPYGALWSSVTLVPWLEVSGRFTRIDDVPGFPGNPQYGQYKDKAFDFKLRLTEESGWLPAIAVGRQDFHGTALFGADYIAASKRFESEGFGRFDLTVGFGDDRIDGAFGGVRWQPAWEHPVAFVAEYDAFDYHNDTYTTRTGFMKRDGGLGVGVEYRYRWLTAQLSRQDSQIGLNLSFTVPLEQRTFIAKTEEPPPVEVERVETESFDSLQATPAELSPMLDALRAEHFYISRIALLDDKSIAIALSSARYSTIGRAASRAARVVALSAPPDTESLTLTIIDHSVPLVTYRFADLGAYRGWLAGTVPPPEFQRTLSVSYARTEDWADLQLEGMSPAEFVTVEDGSQGETIFYRGSILSGFRLGASHPTFGSFTLTPLKLGYVFNDPAGVFKYDFYSLFGYSRPLFGGTYLDAAVRVTLAENISDTTTQSNSLLPHVRSDQVEYRRQGGRVSLAHALVGHIGNPADRVYTWVTAGLIEEAFGGVGGEVLYLPETGNWATDFQMYAVKQRNFDGELGFRDYQTVTALASLHYRVPKVGVTLTARGGRFLAKDNGVRFEAKRRFKSGFEVGAWYSFTDADDITHPGSPGNPYNDKGIFLRFAAGPVMPYDTDAYADFSVSPWLRDPGQMINANRLYDAFERRLLLNLKDLGPWSDFGQ